MEQYQQELLRLMQLPQTPENKRLLKEKQRELQHLIHSQILSSGQAPEGFKEQEFGRI